MDYALTRDQTLRLSYDQSASKQKNLGVGGSDLTERAYSNTSHDHEFRAQVVGPFGRRTFGNSRVQLQWQDSDAVSVTAARTLVVNGAFTSGGAQVSGGGTRKRWRPRPTGLRSRKHTMRTGVRDRRR